METPAQVTLERITNMIIAGLNEAIRSMYSLLQVTHPAPVSLRICTLAGEPDANQS